ncbi:DUF6798 domain-containing protein [Tropicimonas sp.]|uniref:DUF6798 domain-containing protein n=1 Tax=Tropicimonas sp. TaxID=2067044 RepID=UPI003A8BAEF3
MREHHAPADIYLTSPDDADFRLAAMTAQLMTWKTHPYLDVEVIEWKRRGDLATRVFPEKRPGAIDCAALSEVSAAYPVTHLLVDSPARRPAVVCDGLEPLFHSEEAAVYRIVR